MNAVQIHLAINHLTIIAAMIGTFVLIYGLAVKSNTTVKAALYVFLTGAVVGVITYFSGHGAEDFVHERLGIAEEPIHRHEEAATYTFIVYVVLAVVSLVTLLMIKKQKSSVPAWRIICLVVALLTTGMAVYTGHLGGLIRHPELEGKSIPLNTAVPSSDAEERE